MYTNPSQHPVHPVHPVHPGHPGPHFLFQADPNWQHMLRQKRDMILGALHPHIGRTIRVTTLEGHTYEGVLVNVDGHHAYLQVNPHGHPHGQHRPIYTPAQFNQILTLVLFELLVIVLLA
ncbi:LSm family protein [Paenibacillus alginolyticus]|uniref:Uncharacterized protein n=1 Tax=Paenibacillus alginolyticus TaxID=59839 RepID=A0ABT4G7I6_9BACL|nr:hypothetical protein [Paenibacillus alginolyticus]MCY9692138.1 hypothetical protein [Paenibacillus alginolyticus]MEC0147903.1 hypothetical protein [Paenibacillus alginolyticus]